MSFEVLALLWVYVLITCAHLSVPSSLSTSLSHSPIYSVSCSLPLPHSTSLSPSLSLALPPSISYSPSLALPDAQYEV